MPAHQTVVFAGPSLPPRARPEAADLIWRSPARRGDLDALTLEPGTRVALVDGYLIRDHPPSPTEVLGLVERGYEVWGCSSLGALRAVELRHHGVHGFGWVYGRLVDRSITYDDELVATLDPRTDQAFGLFLANVRFGLERLVTAGQSSGSQAALIIDGLRAVHFADRTPELGRRLATAAGLTPAAIEELLMTDVKRRDALGLLRLLAASRQAA
jgi:TfuA protein